MMQPNKPKLEQAATSTEAQDTQHPEEKKPEKQK